MDTQKQQTKRALLIAIGDYPYKHWKLDGCQNDMALIYQALTSQFGFDRANMQILRDEEATQAAILDAFETLVESTEQDDIVVVHYAGHGSQMPDREGDEADELDETIVPYDSGRGNDPNRDITDDQLNVFLQRLAAKTSYTTMIFDCCHSGTIMRDAFGGKTRSVQAETRSVEELDPSPFEGDEEAKALAARNDPRLWLELSDKYVLIAGCQDDEESAEKVVGKDSYGALTWYLSQELSKAGPGTTYRDVFEGIAGQVTANCARQHPAIEGNLNRELFGVRDIEPLSYILVTARDGDEVTLAGGAAHGLTVGSLWNVVPGGTGTVDEEDPVLGEIKITSVSAVESTAEIQPGDKSDAIVAPCRAIETVHAHGDTRLKCQVSPADEAPELVQAIKAELVDNIRLIESDGSEPADVCIYVIGARETASPDDLVPQLGALSATTFVAVGAQGELVIPHETIGSRKRDGRDGEEFPAFISNLEALSKFRQALAIRNTNPTSKLHGTVSMEMKRRLPDGSLEPVQPDPDTGQVTFEEGEGFEVSVTNNGPKPIYFNLVDFDPALVVQHVTVTDDPLGPGSTWALELETVLPDAKKLPPAAVQSEDAVTGLETLKLFVTEQPADFSFLDSPGTRSTGEEGSPIELMMKSAHGMTMRGVKVVEKKTEKDWTTVEKTFVIRRPS